MGFIDKISRKWNENDLSKGVRGNELEGSLTKQNEATSPVEKTPATTTAAATNTINWSSLYRRRIGGLFGLD